MHRLFVALRPPAPVRDQLLGLAGGVDGARWQDEDQLHLTLRFAGTLPPGQADDLAEALGQVAATPFPLQLAGVGHFERNGRPHSLWAGVAASDPLAVLHGRVERACRRAGLPSEGHRFAPHVTVARLGRSAGPVGGWLQAHGAWRSEEWLADHMILYESHLTPLGAEYQPVVRYSLRG